ncbi:MAG TPA: thiamine phosphate synthase [Nitrospirae bacterium]|nr:thiamine phosphate synthase [Nitrospirota bacterium]
MKVDFSLYLITDRSRMKAPFYEGIEDALKGGVKALQLREKDLPVRQLYEMACKLREITSRYGARLFVNDRLDVALSVEADGLHLAGTSIPPRAVRKITGGKMLIGVSAHTLEQAIEAEREGADFITFGPVYETPSKKKYGPPVGIGKLKEVAEKVSIPVFGLGGIKIERVSDVLKSGARGVALISAILSSDNIERESARFITSVEGVLRKAPSSCSLP